jgi:hypothetical protein
MSNKLDPHWTMISKLLLLLSSDKDGEVLAAVRAINRILQKVGSDWHDLLKISKEGPGPTDHRADAWFCLNSVVEWREVERNFLNDMMAVYKLTEKQAAWLTRLKSRAMMNENIRK